MSALVHKGTQLEFAGSRKPLPVADLAPGIKKTSPCCPGGTGAYRGMGGFRCEIGEEGAANSTIPWSGRLHLKQVREICMTSKVEHKSSGYRKGHSVGNGVINVVGALLLLSLAMPFFLVIPL
ncbi:hypothetical protein, partial [Halochromatium sp.]